MKRITNGKHIYKGYEYRGYEIRNHGYYPPDKCVWWEAIDVITGCASFHATTKRQIKSLIDSEIPSEKVKKEGNDE